MSDFRDLWKFVVNRNITIVQENNELEHIFNLIQGCESYLEIGTAEGNSLYVLAHALKPGAKITCVDLGENHTKPRQVDVMQKLAPTYTVAMYHGNSMDEATYPNKEKHDVVLIDAGHDYESVASDIKMYAGLATKYVLFHDVTLPGVKRAVEDYVKGKKYREFVNTPDMGFGILEVV